jgi:hypothetical protein
MHRRLLMLPFAVLAGAGLLASAPAIAQEPYPPAEPLLSVSAGTVVAGGSVVVEGTGFGPGEDVLITVATNALAAPQLQQSDTAEPIAIVPVARAVSASPEQTVTADGEGGFTATVTLYKPGQATITATGQESGVSASVTVTVLARADGLPETGSAGVPMLLRIGGGTLAAGAALLLATLIWRRRRDRAAT